MVNITPFQGYRFNPNVIENLGDVMAPPYDTVSGKELDSFYEKEEHNIIRINKGISYPEDNETENCFTRAAAYLQQWISEQALMQEERPALYLYQQEVQYKNTTYTNQGVVGLLELQELGENILSCEQAHKDVKGARYTLVEKTAANVSMINCIYLEYEKDLMNFLNQISDKNAPDMEFETPETVVGGNVRQRVWVITDTEKIAFIQEHLKNQTLYIADGQTRYEVSLEYQRQCRENNPNHTGKEPYNYIMTLFTNAFNDGLVQLPVHRMVSFPKNFSEDFFIACAQDYFKIEKIIIDTASQDFIETMKKQIATTRRENKFGFYCGGKYFYRMTFRNEAYLKSLLPDKSDAYRSLDVTVLNQLLLGELLNIPEEQHAERIKYTTRITHGVEAVLSGEYGCMFIMNPVRAEQIRGVALARERIPERSIFIFPKASTGVVIYKM